MMTWNDSCCSFLEVGFLGDSLDFDTQLRDFELWVTVITGYTQTILQGRMNTPFMMAVSLLISRTFQNTVWTPVCRALLLLLWVFRPCLSLDRDCSDCLSSKLWPRSVIFRILKPETKRFLSETRIDILQCTFPTLHGDGLLWYLL